MSEQDLRNSLTAIAHDLRGEHPSPDALLGYHLGELAEDRIEAVQDHLARCRQCTDVLLDFQSFPTVEPAPETASVEDAEVDDLWRGVQASLTEAERIAAVTTPWYASVGLAQAAAVFFCVTSLALTGALLRSQAPTTAVVTPKLNLPIFELQAIDASSVRAPDGGKRQLVPSAADGAVILLVLAESAPREEYEVVVSTNSEVVWETRELERTPEGLLSFYIERGFLPEGHYQLQLKDPGAEDQETPLARFRLSLQYD